ncbi:hypothetical protein B0T13DRAFT_86094 [Neurospora crassa]|nr:hypothetical protein B0T13DRAFT_86094 [Neurospora crassa]
MPPPPQRYVTPTRGKQVIEIRMSLDRNHRFSGMIPFCLLASTLMTSAASLRLLPPRGQNLRYARMSVDKNPKEEGENDSRPAGCHGAQGLGPSPEDGHESGIALRRSPNSAAGIQPLSLRPGLFLSAFFEWGAIVEKRKWRGQIRQGAECARSEEPCDLHTAFG